MHLLETAISAPCESGQVDVRGCKINFVTWGQRGKPGVILVHGSNAHLEWWRVIAPFLTEHFRVVALDLSGAGDSAWRKSYSGESFAEEILAVSQAAQLGPKPYVVGHSFGGFVTLESAHLFGAKLGGVILVDFTIRPPGDEDDIVTYRNQLRAKPARPRRVYKNKQAILERFRLIPEQSCKNPQLLSYVAENSICETKNKDGWVWKFDPDMFRNLDIESSLKIESTEKLLNLECRSAFIMGEQSQDYSQRSLHHTRQITAGKIPLFDIPHTHHHLMFDEPVAMITAIKTVLLTWEMDKT